MPLHTRNTSTRRLAACLFPLALGLSAALALLLLAGSSARLAYANSLTFPGCGATIQQCIDLASPGDTILIQPGNYTESLTLAKAVSLTGALSSTTILHALPHSRVLTAETSAVDASVVISGLTFTGGVLDGILACEIGCGGAIALEFNAQPRLTNLIIANNTTNCAGGGIYAAPGSPLVLSHVTVIGNLTANCIPQGGGVYAGDAVTISDSLFEQNTGDDGGGLAAIHSAAIFDTLFVNNVGGLGGAIQSVGTAPGDALTIRNSVFLNNRGGFGAGAYVYGAADIAGTLFQGNQGGALQVGGRLWVTNTRFIANSSQDYSAGIEAGAGDVRVVNSLFAGNNATAGHAAALEFGGAGRAEILFSTIATPTLSAVPAIVIRGGAVGLTDTIIASYTTGISRTAGAAYQDYNLFFNVPLTSTAGVAGGSHSLTGDPAFVDPLGADYHLTPGSAALNAGINAGIAFDFDYEPRPFGGGFDIGFDERFTGPKLFLPVVLR